jgi:GNAT superfamily N-acetyltransferase
MAIDYRTPTAEHLPELGRICYEAFKDIAERHGFEPDFASPEFAAMVIGMLLASETHYAIAAFNDDEPAGSNYLLMSDKVAAVGPITVDPSKQGVGIGRQLMVSVLAHARKRIRVGPSHAGLIQHDITLPLCISWLRCEAPGCADDSGAGAGGGLQRPSNHAG